MGSSAVFVLWQRLKARGLEAACPIALADGVIDAVYGFDLADRSTPCAASRSLWERACPRWTPTMTRGSCINAALSGFSRVGSLPQDGVRPVGAGARLRLARDGHRYLHNCGATLHQGFGLDRVHIHFFGNGLLWFRFYSGSLLEEPKSKQKALAPPLGTSLRLGMPVLRH